MCNVCEEAAHKYICLAYCWLVEVLREQAGKNKDQKKCREQEDLELKRIKNNMMTLKKTNNQV